MCASGPSFPTHSVPLTARITPIVLMIKTRALKTSGYLTPFNVPINSGNPEPAAPGATYTVRTPAQLANITE